jgi:hypothetical protein
VTQEENRPDLNLTMATQATDGVLTVQSGSDGNEQHTASTEDAIFRVSTRNSVDFFLCQGNPILASLFCSEDTTSLLKVLPDDHLVSSNSPAVVDEGAQATIGDVQGTNSEKAVPVVRKSMRAIELDVRPSAMLMETPDAVEVSDRVWSKNQEIPIGVGRVTAILPAAVSPLLPFSDYRGSEAKNKRQQTTVRLCRFVFLFFALLGVIARLSIHVKSSRQEKRGIAAQATRDDTSQSGAPQQPETPSTDVPTTITRDDRVPLPTPVAPLVSSPSVAPFEASCREDVLTATTSCFLHRADTIVLNVTACDPQPNDWVGIYLDGVSQENLDSDYIDWRYVCNDEMPCTDGTYHRAIYFDKMDTIETYRAFLIRGNESTVSTIVPRIVQSNAFSVARECGNV